MRDINEMIYRLDRIEQMFIDIRDVCIYLREHDMDIKKSAVSVILSMTAERCDKALDETEKLRNLIKKEKGDQK
jgi:tRNA A58 N-methylase Trm61